MRTRESKLRPERGVGACGRKSGCEFLQGEYALKLYRAKTQQTLRRYFQLSLDLGRLPSLLGGDIFRAKVSSSRSHTFEDLVIFVHDIERCLEELDPASLETIAAVVFLDQSHEEAGVSMGLSRRQVERRYGAALDKLSRKLLVTNLMRPLPLTVDEPDCGVCLRNPALAVGDDVSAKATMLYAEKRASDLNDGGCPRPEGPAELPPKKPVVSVREQVRGRVASQCGSSVSIMIQVTRNRTE